MKNTVHFFDRAITNTIAAWPRSWRTRFVIITSLGDPFVTLGIGVVIMVAGWSQDSWPLALAGAVIWITLLVGYGLKLLFERARPLTEYAATYRIDSFSFPSGHSSGSMIAYSVVAYLSYGHLSLPYATMAALLCTVIIIGVGLSRIYLGAHFPSDVVAGWMLGAAALAVVVLLIRPLG